MPTWEQFAGILQTSRESLKKACAACPDIAWAKERLSQLQQLDGPSGQPWLNKAYKAWEVLGTVENHQKAIWLFFDATQEVYEETLKRLGLPQENKRRSENKRRKELLRALAKAHKQAKQAGVQFVVALKKYAETAQRVDKSGATVPSYDVIRASDFLPEAFQQIIEKNNAWRQSSLQCFERAIQIVEQFRQLGEYAPRVKEPGARRGRQEKKYLNAAFRELVDIIEPLLPLPSTQEAERLVHALLYVAGIWPNPDPQGIPGKIYPLRKRPSSKI